MATIDLAVDTTASLGIAVLATVLLSSFALENGGPRVAIAAGPP